MAIKRFFILLIIFTLTSFAYAEEATTLTIAGNVSSEKIDAYSQSHPGVAIKWMSVEDDTELIQEALSRSDKADWTWRSLLSAGASTKGGTKIT